MLTSEENICKICPHECNINRENARGFCRANNNIKLALASVHYYEEPCISGENGSGTIFFSNCNLKCKYCQNYKISWESKGKEITIEELAEKFIELQNLRVNNINLVTPTMYVNQIIEAIKIARKKGLNLPIIYNTNGYENVQTIKKLNGYIDVYLPDLKYYYDEVAFKYSGIKRYFEKASKAILEMYNQVGEPLLDEKGIIKKGLIIRHLVLPNNIQNSKLILKWIKNNIPQDVYVSIMAQYFPCYKAKEIEEINRKLSKEELEQIKKFVIKLDFKNGYMQELGEHEEEYVPSF